MELTKKEGQQTKKRRGFKPKKRKTSYLLVHKSNHHELVEGTKYLIKGRWSKGNKLFITVLGTDDKLVNVLIGEDGEFEIISEYEEV